MRKKNMKKIIESLKSLKKGVGSGVGSGSIIVRGADPESAPKCHGSPTLVSRYPQIPQFKYSICRCVGVGTVKSGSEGFITLCSTSIFTLIG
jgi:hypothetical protein